ncbi:MAG: hypothetical protein ACREOQ_06055, partial [Gemmatimonadales bacterium]
MGTTAAKQYEASEPGQSVGALLEYGAASSMPTDVAAPMPAAAPTPSAALRLASGLYMSRRVGAIMHEELRLDVDGRYPQMVASGTIVSGLTQVIHWIANLTAAGPNHWTGSIWYRDPAGGMAHTDVDIQVNSATGPSGQHATAIFSGAGQPNRTTTFKYLSPYYRTIEFEFDSAGGQFSPVYAQGDPGNGIGGYDLASPADRAFAFDYDGSGKLDHLALY